MYYLRNVQTLSRVTLSAPLSLRDREILTPEAIEFLARLQTAFADRRKKLNARRSLVQREIDLGRFPNFTEATRTVREGIWTVRTAPADLSDRRVEVTAPAGDAVRVIEAINSGANVCVLDFEDTLSPAWAAVLTGQRLVRDSVREELTAISPEGRKYGIERPVPALLVRPRGWHAVEKHFCLDGEPVSATLFDFGLFAFHNARELLSRGSGPYLSVPKLENRFEAALWNDVIRFAEEYLRIPHGSTRVSVLIESVLAAFEMDEILYEFRDRAAGLACDRSDTLFSVIKKFNRHPLCVLSHRDSADTAASGCIGALETLLVQTCHRRGTHAIGPTITVMPSSNDRPAREAAKEIVRLELANAVTAGFDGTSVAYPAIVGLAREVFDRALPDGHQMERTRTDVSIGREDLLSLPAGSPTEAALRDSIDVAVRYLEAWLCGCGNIPLRGRLEDASAAEVARARVWQWLHQGVWLDETTPLTPALFRKVYTEELDRIHEAVGAERCRRGQFELASRIFFNMVHDADFTQFFTTKAYQHL